MGDGDADREKRLDQLSATVRGLMREAFMEGFEAGVDRAMWEELGSGREGAPPRTAEAWKESDSRTAFTEEDR